MNANFNDIEFTLAFKHSLNLSLFFYVYVEDIMFRITKLKFIKLFIVISVFMLRIIHTNISTIPPK